MKKLAIVLTALLAVSCGSEDDHSTHTATDTGTSNTEDTSTEDTGSTPADTATDDAPAEAATKPATPQITTIVPMAGAYHVNWKLNDTGLTKVELWRSNDGAAATLVKALAGTANNFHDGAATGTVVKYCWTVKTFRGTLESDPSPEKCSK